MTKEEKEDKFYFIITEEVILNKEFDKKHPNMAGGRLEIRHDSYPYSIEEIRLLLPREKFEQLREVFDFMECDYFQIGDIHSEEIKKWLRNKNNKKL